MAAFTLTDLTLNEYATMARMLGADPSQAMLSPASTKWAEAHAALLVMRDRRDGNSATTVRDKMTMTLREMQTALGFNEEDDDAPAGDEDAPTVDDIAEQAAYDATGAAVDPTVPPASHGSASQPDTPPRSSETAPAQR